MELYCLEYSYIIRYVYGIAMYMVGLQYNSIELTLGTTIQESIEVDIV